MTKMAHEMTNNECHRYTIEAIHAHRSEEYREWLYKVVTEGKEGECPVYEGEG